MAAAAFHELPYPEAAVIEADTLAEQTLLLASELPDRPVVLGGCCCSHVGAIEALSSGEERLAVVWIDAHGDLNTPETSPSGNAWGMPLRMVLDDGAVLAQDVALIGARNLDPPEVDFIAAAGIHTGDDAIERALEGADAVYVALDADSLEPGDLAVFMPEPDGLRLTEVEELLAEIAARKRIAGLGSPDSCTTRPTSPSSHSLPRRWACDLAPVTASSGHESKLPQWPKHPDRRLDREQAGP
jgi:arginase family enzyme